ncbi:nuclear transport factor 2 family protein [Nonomuraea sp. NBC_01738]|uniref:YybH family protein n=1 Tax=Nonomuraea sp. NBC_01738 TaxID=2976003 RepID=UPI002E10246B|nr:nuclear transport factor 2 family protein [Nonomuraea sp. NBC_01738]
MTNALKTHLDAVSGRDLAAYSATIHDDVLVVLPNGSRLEGRAAVEDFHREWFADLDWTQEMTPVWTKETDGTLVAAYEADYRDGDYHARNLVTLVFTRVGEDWLLIHDQNTRL